MKVRRIPQQQKGNVRSSHNFNSLTVSSKERNEICQEWVGMFAAANISLSKTDHPSVREFLQKRVVNGGAIPKAKQLQECYLKREYTAKIEEVKEILKDKPLSIMTDEMSDDNGRYVLNVMAAPLELKDEVIKTYLLDCVFLETTNHSTVAQAVVSVVYKFSIDFNNIMVVNTDNAAYMKKAYKTVFKCLFPKSVHITCLAHIMSLLGDTFNKPFKDVDKYIKNANVLQSWCQEIKVSCPPQRDTSFGDSKDATKSYCYKAWSMFQDLETMFHGGSVTQMEVSKFFLEEFTARDRSTLHDICSQAYALVSSKLDKYMSPEGQPGIDFLKHVQFFNPSKLIFLPPASDLSISGIQSVPDNEINKYTQQLGPNFVKQAPTSDLDLTLFWRSVRDSVPALAACAECNIYATVTSADVERSFSIYNLILSDRRRSLRVETLRSLAFLCYNQFVGAEFFP